MPNLLSRYFPFVRGVFVLLLACLFFGCGDKLAAGKQETIANPQEHAELVQLNNAFSSSKRVSKEQFSRVKALKEKYPMVGEVRQAYRNALVIRSDWDALEKFLTEIPRAELDQDNLLTLAKVYIKLGKYEESIEILRPVVEAGPNNVETSSLLGLAYFYSDDLARSASVLDAVWQQLVDLKRSDEINARGIIDFRQNNLQSAIEKLNIALSIDPENVTASNTLSQVYARTGNAEQAEKYRQLTVDINQRKISGLRDANNQVGAIVGLETAWKNKDHARVIELAKILLEKSPGKSEKIVLYQYLNESYKATGNESESQGALAEIRKLQQQK